MAEKSASATVTAKYGPGLQATSKVITGIKSYFVDVQKETIAFHKEPSGDQNAAQIEFDLTGVTTFTVTISSGNQAIVIS